MTGKKSVRSERRTRGNARSSGKKPAAVLRTVKATAEAPQEVPVVDQIRALIQANGLAVGDRLPGERELAAELSVTRGSVRKGLGYLAAIGMLEVRHGAGAFLADAKVAFGSAPLEMLRTAGGFEAWQMFEARRALETELVGLAAERRTAEHSAALAEELAEMFASVDHPAEFLVHDVRFHRVVAQASGNPILAALMDAIVGALYEERRTDAGTRENRVAALEAHREMYHAIKSQNAKAARSAMERHLRAAEG